MKVLITGASGLIGGGALERSLAHPKITKVVAFVRRPLSGSFVDHPKLECVIVEDLGTWTDNILLPHADAAGIIWAIGTNTGSVPIDYEYPLAFMHAMVRVLASCHRQDVFKFVQLSGKLVRQDQDQKLWLLEKPRKLKGKLEIEALEFERAHAHLWKTLIVKPGGVAPNSVLEHGVQGLVTSLALVFGENWSVRVGELGAFMAYLVVDGKDEESITLNARIVQKGREILEKAK